MNTKTVDFGDGMTLSLYYVTCRDAGKTALVLGPFTDEKRCKMYAEFREDNPDSCHADVASAVYKIDPKSHFYEWGMCRVTIDEKNGFVQKGILNKMHPEIWDKVLE